MIAYRRTYVTYVIYIVLVISMASMKSLHIHIYIYISCSSGYDEYEICHLCDDEAKI